MPNYANQNINEIATPCLIYYTDIIRANIQKSIVIAGDAKRIRSHVKSHKTVEILKLQAEYGINKFKTATIAETEMVAEAGFTDIMLAYPLVGPTVSRFITLMKKYPKARFIGLADDLQAAQQVSREAAQNAVTIELYLDIDAGFNRSGVTTKDAETLFPQIAALANLRLTGLHIYDGHTRDFLFDARFKNTSAIYDSVKILQKNLEKQGFNNLTLTMGGTPSFSCYAKFAEIELSPGTCFLQDAGYESKFPDMPFVPGAAVATRVISASNGRITFDLGTKAIASDPAFADRVRLLGDLDLEPMFQSEEHWVARVKSGRMPAVGEVFYAIPWHVCPTSAMYEKIAAVDEKRVISRYFLVASRQRTITI